MVILHKKGLGLQLFATWFWGFSSMRLRTQRTGHPTCMGRMWASVGSCPRLVLIQSEKASSSSIRTWKRQRWLSRWFWWRSRATPQSLRCAGFPLPRPLTSLHASECCLVLTQPVTSKRLNREETKDYRLHVTFLKVWLTSLDLSSQQRCSNSV